MVRQKALLFACLQGIGIEQDCEGSIIDERDLHLGAETAVRYAIGAQILARELEERLIKPVRLVGSARTGERRTIAFLAIGVEGELAHDENGPGDVMDAQIRFARFVAEDAQFRDLAPQLFACSSVSCWLTPSRIM